MRLLLIGLLTLSFSVLQAQQTWEEMMGDPNVSLFELKAAFDAANPNLEAIAPGNGHKPYKRWEYMMETRVDENGFYNYHERQEAYKNYLKTKKNEKAFNNPWTSLGPDVEPSGNNGIGRINVIAQHPTDTDTMFVGTPAGGMWKTIDGGTTWSTNTDLFTNLGVSDIVYHPTNFDIMYLVTGDRDHNDTSTYGIMKSTDGGDTWVLTSFAPNANGLPGFYLIHRLLIDPNDPLIMVASTTSGVFRTTNDWATWTEVLPNDCLRHMEFKPGDSNTIYGTTSGNYCGGLNNSGDFFRSTNNGVSWTEISLPNSNDVERIGIGVTDDNVNAVYLMAARNDPAGSNDFEALYHSTNSGASFTEITPSHAPSLGSQQWYDWSFVVDPNDEDIMYAGGVHIEKTTNGGLNWTRVTNNGPNNVHVDHHYAQYFGSTLWVGSDGGLWSTDNGASSWDNHNDGLAISQYYRISNAETDAGILLAGSQDNGSHQLKNGSWIYEFGGDGMDNAIDPNDEDNLFVSYQYGNFYRSTNGGNNFSSMINSNTTGVSGAWVTPIKIDENNTSILYTGYDRIWKSTNDGSTWTDPNGAPLTSGSSRLQYIDIAKSNSNYIYTTNYNSIWKTTNGGNSWTTTTDPGSSIRWIEIDPDDEDHVWICRDNDVMESTNGGNSWTDISSNLPNIDMNTIVYDNNAGTLHVGSDLGVYSLDDGTTTWSAFNNSLPNVIILELDILESGDIIRAATFGRGVWEASLAQESCSIDNIVDAGIEICDPGSNTYERILTVVYTGAPSSGTLDVNGQSFPIGSSPQNLVLGPLPMDGQSQNVTATFSDETSCTLTVSNVFTNPTMTTYYADADGDGFGDANDSLTDCQQPTGYVLDNTDCDDNDPNNYPGNTEVCDGEDNNCDGNIDEGLSATYYPDSDGDGFGDASDPLDACAPPAGYVLDNTDCDDNDANNYPGNTEVCDGEDNNCDGVVDENGTNTYYADADGDGFGDQNITTMGCSAPAGYVTDNTDCDDADPNNYPGNTEVCDGQDNNCDGIVDEGCNSNNCDDTYVVINTITQNTYRAEININSDALVNNGQSILFTAGTDIDLVAPFEVAIGTEFEARIEPCTPTSPIQNENGDWAIPSDLYQFVDKINRLLNFENSIDINISSDSTDYGRSFQVKQFNAKTIEEIINSLQNGLFTITVSDNENSVSEKVFIIK